ncbi:MAG: bifunctional UDP-N-acetylglucosamine diphosphorylase/glucosamine-1-phosphate N-acetyltransferase GlmU [Chloroflexota bacterium]|nr:bifunctional UDP-N-acetylglucosamine diphosphorylase/glucosamine-1-phosphate N-acetyltransferase GlmU [Chloroflexota bacterium]
MSSSPTSQSESGDPPSTGGLAAAILAAGQGTRMRSARHKMLHSLAGRPLISRVLDLVTAAGAQSIIVVLGHLAEQVRRELPKSVDSVVQEPQLGTAHAVKVAAEHIKATGADLLLVHLGDVALVRERSLQRLVQAGVGPAAPVALLSAEVGDPHGYGRVIRNADGSVESIIEEVDATPAQRAVREIWSGAMLFWTPWLWQRLDALPVSAKGEYYLPGLVNLARADGLEVRAVLAEDEQEVHGVNDLLQLAQANTILRQRVLEGLMRRGVTVVDPASTYIEPEVEIEADVVVEPGCHLRGRTRIARDCLIGPNSVVADSQIGAGSRVWMSVVESARVGQGVSIGPFSHLRPGAIIEDGVTIGNYAEVKNSRIGAGTQQHHFSYVGDADVGERVNIGAGTITVNFSSETGLKSRTVVEDDASLGSDTLLVAPVRVGARAMTAAGAVVTHDIPAGEVWIGAPARPLRQRRGQPLDEARPSR